MNVKQLIEQLQKLNPEAEVEIPVSVYTRAYPAAYGPVDLVVPSHTGGVRIWTHLPDNMYTVERNSRQNKAL